MHVGTVLRLLRRARTLRARSHWDRPTLLAHQTAAIAATRAHAYRASAFYRRHHEGRHDRPLHELPPVTKAELMTHFDAAITDSAVRHADLAAHVAGPGRDPGMRYLGRYQVCATAGTTGTPGLFPFDETEWLWVLASYARAQDWAGERVSPFRRTRLAVVASPSGLHQSARVGRSVESWWRPTLRLDAAQPVAAQVAALSAWRPDHLVGYASALRALALAQRADAAGDGGRAASAYERGDTPGDTPAGALQIHPRRVFSASEVLTPDTRRLLEDVWGPVVYETYGATETGLLAATCERRDGMHWCEDLVVPEIVDESHRPVPPGTWGAHLLVTVLFARTLPLIRYVIGDRVRAAVEPCACGRPFLRVAAIEGRQEDVLDLRDARGARRLLPPVAVHAVLDGVPVSAWQLVQTSPAALTLHVVPSAGTPPLDALARRLTAALEAHGVVGVAVEARAVAAVARTRAGKAPLIVRATADAPPASAASAPPADPRLG